LTESFEVNCALLFSSGPTDNDVNLDDNIFTFKPKVSSASAKIVENLGTDFMARQQQHIERQRRNVSFFEVMCCTCKSRGPFALTTHLPWVRSP
jgi:hypothetical protein